ncbi:MAG: ATP-binding cassette domain-containing protein, partial [Synergistaceae bacterium]|nr:ATP-binding cassette domain-containing protein [Synergistaceae bacterium]
VYELDDSSKTVRFHIPEAPESGWQVLSVKNLSKNYGSLEVFSGLDFTVNRGERVALVGVNGAGKSTLLRLLSGVDEPSEGAVRFGHNVKHVFYSQESAQNVNYSCTVWEEARQAPSKLTEAGKRTLLGSFLFSGEDIRKSVSVLSGGEKARLALFKLMLAESNFLILDEPTNHLDMNTKDLFQQALLQYGGTLLIVSHDRHFLDDLADRVLEIRDGRLFDYPGNYSWFLAKREELLKRQELPGESFAAKSSAHKTRHEKKSEKKNEALDRERLVQKTRAVKKELTSLEARIEKLEARRNEIDALLCDPHTLADSARVQSLMKERGELEQELAESYTQWEHLTLRLENGIENDKENGI